MAAVQAETQPQKRPPLAEWGYNWRGPILAGLAGTVVLIFLLSIAGLSAWFFNRAQDTARVESVAGQVQIANRNGTDWEPISTGDRLRRGQRIRTLGASTATLVFFEGTRTTLSANSDITLAKLNGSAGKSLQVEIHQNSGETFKPSDPSAGNKKLLPRQHLFRHGQRSRHELPGQGKPERAGAVLGHHRRGSREQQQPGGHPPPRPGC